MTTAVKVKIKNFCEITSSKRIFANDYLPSGVPFYRGKEISAKQKSTNEIDNPIFISRKKFEEIKSKFGAPLKGDILLTSVGTIGNPYLVKEGDEFYFKDGNLTWFKNFKGLNSQWLYYWLLSPEGKSELNKCTIGASQKAYTINLLEGLEISLPSISSQNKIASVLTAYDDLIKNNEKRIKILEEMAQRLYTEWFVKFKFPGHEKIKMVDSDTEYGMIPEGWAIKRLQDLTSVITKGTTPTTLNKKFVKEGINFIKIESVGESGHLFEENFAKIDEETHELLKRSKIQDGDILFSIAGAIGRNVLITKRFLPANTNQALAIIRPAKSRYIYYLFQIISSKQFYDFSISRIVQTAQANVSLSVLSSAKILFPDEITLGNYNQKVSDIFKSIDNLRNKNSMLCKIRDLLIPQLVTGKRELK